MRFLLDYLSYSKLKKLDMDGNERMIFHAEILNSKKMLREVFCQFHHIFEHMQLKFLSGKGVKVELGAGVFPIKNTFPDVLSTDIVDGSGIDFVLDAQNMALENSSVKVFYAQNCFHHLSNPDSFFCELERVLVEGGGAILLEPYYGFFARFIFKRLFRTEGFDCNAKSWSVESHGPMMGANQALSYVVFIRDRELFLKKYPQLDLVHQEICGNYLMYLLSGGLNFIQLAPNWAMPLVSLSQHLFSPFNRFIGLHHVLVIKKKIS